MSIKRKDVVDILTLMVHGLMGMDAEPRKAQVDALVAALVRRKPVLLLQRTGWGKSIVYFAASELLARAGEGMVLVVSPLISLMNDQVSQASSMGLVARTINTTNRKDASSILREVADGEVQLLIISPEFLSDVARLEKLRNGVGMLVVDEAHCIEDWGDFRPDYKRIQRVRRFLGEVPTVAVTATADDYTVDLILEQIGKDAKIIKGPLLPENLEFHRVEDQGDRLEQWIEGFLRKNPGQGIIYAFKQATVERIAACAQRVTSAAAYHANVADSERALRQSRWQQGETRVIVATSAFGMGVHYEQARWVVTLGIPPSIIGLAQYSGRAGRDGKPALAVMVPCGKEDRWLRREFPTWTVSLPTELELVHRTLTDAPTSLNDVVLKSHLPRTDVVARLKRLDVDGMAISTPDGWIRGDQPWHCDHERHAQSLLRREQAVNLAFDYTTTSKCLPGFIKAGLGYKPGKPCGKCSNCTGKLPKELRIH